MCSGICCDLHLHFLDDIKHIFMCFATALPTPIVSSVSYMSNVFKSSAHFVMGCLPFKSSLRPGYKTFIRYVFSNYTLLVHGGLFVFLTMSFQERKLSVLMKSSLSIFILLFMFFVCVLRNLCLTQGHKDFLLYFKSFMVFGFIFGLWPIISFRLVLLQNLT